MTGKSPAIQNIHRGTNTMQKKSYEHKEFIEACYMKHVVDIKDENGKMFLSAQFNWSKWLFLKIFFF